MSSFCIHLHRNCTVLATQNEASAMLFWSAKCYFRRRIRTWASRRCVAATRREFSSAHICRISSAWMTTYSALASNSIIWRFISVFFAFLCVLFVRLRAMEKLLSVTSKPAIRWHLYVVLLLVLSWMVWGAAESQLCVLCYFFRSVSSFVLCVS